MNLSSRIMIFNKLQRHIPSTSHALPVLRPMAKEHPHRKDKEEDFGYRRSREGQIASMVDWVIKWLEAVERGEDPTRLIEENR